jgi:hypothetical protein
MVQVICNIHRITELCQRKFSAKSRPARRLSYLTIGGLFRPNHREKLDRIELIDASINSGSGSSHLRYHLVRYSQEYHVRISSILGHYSLLKQALHGCIFGSELFFFTHLFAREKSIGTSWFSKSVKPEQTTLALVATQ